MALTESTMLQLGTLAPDFALPDVVSGKTVRRDDFRGQKGLLVMFICTHCPYVKHIEEGIAALSADYAGKLGMVAISSNDAENYPDDSPSGLKQQAQRLGFRFPYLYDESQEVAHAYKAACTPDIYLFDKAFNLVYRGQFDGSRARKRRSGHRQGSARGSGCGSARREAKRRAAGFNRVQYQMERLAQTAADAAC
jgi:peroxiredoxin